MNNQQSQLKSSHVKNLSPYKAVSPLFSEQKEQWTQKSQQLIQSVLKKAQSISKLSLMDLESEKDDQMIQYKTPQKIPKSSQQSNQSFNQIIIILLILFTIQMIYQNAMLKHESKQLSDYMANVQFNQNDLLFDLLEKTHFQSQMQENIVQQINLAKDQQQELKESFQNDFSSLINIANKDYGTIISKQPSIEHGWTSQSYQNHTNQYYQIKSQLFHFFNPFLKFENIDEIMNSNDIIYKSNSNKGCITFEFDKFELIKAFSISHKSQPSDDNCEINHFQLWGLTVNQSDNQLSSERKNLGNFTFVNRRNKSQKNIQFQAQNLVKQYFKVETASYYKHFRITYENYGNTQFTCIYQLEILI